MSLGRKNKIKNTGFKHSKQVSVIVIIFMTVTKFLLQ